MSDAFLIIVSIQLAMIDLHSSVPSPVWITYQIKNNDSFD